jgi:hypothetical protein
MVVLTRHEFVVSCWGSVSFCSLLTSLSTLRSPLAKISVAIVSLPGRLRLQGREVHGQGNGSGIVYEVGRIFGQLCEETAMRWADINAFVDSLVNRLRQVLIRRILFQ